MNRETVWSFSTARFRVALELSEELDDPADHFQFEEDIDDVRNGNVLWFCASVVVYLDDVEVASDHLGGCAYSSAREFYASHRDPDPANRNCAATNAKHIICHYFPSMVREACALARKRIGDMPEVRSVA